MKVENGVFFKLKNIKYFQKHYLIH